MNGAAGRISGADTDCVICQYVVQRIQQQMSKYNNLGAAAGLAGNPSMIEAQAHVYRKQPSTPATPIDAFLELEATTSIVPPDPYMYVMLFLIIIISFFSFFFVHN